MSQRKIAAPNVAALCAHNRPEPAIAMVSAKETESTVEAKRPISCAVDSTPVSRRRSVSFGGSKIHPAARSSGLLPAVFDTWTVAPRRRDGLPSAGRSLAREMLKDRAQRPGVVGNDLRMLRQMREGDRDLDRVLLIAQSIDQPDLL